MATALRGQTRYDAADFPIAETAQYGYPIVTTTGAGGVAPAMAALPATSALVGRTALYLSVAAVGTGVAGSKVRRNLSHYDVGQNGVAVGSGGLGTTSVTPYLRIRGQVHLGNQPAGLSSSNRHRIFSLNSAGETALANLQIYVSGATIQLRSFTRMGTKNTAVTDVYGAGNDPIFEILYKAASGAGNNGDYRVWLNGAELTDLREQNHNNTTTISNFMWESTRVGSSYGAALDTYVIGDRWTNIEGEEVPLRYFENFPVPVDPFPDVPGLVTIRDRAHNKVLIQVHAVPGLLGYATPHAKIKPTVAQFTATATQELTATNGWHATFEVGSLNSDTEYPFYVVLFSDNLDSDPVEFGPYSFRTHQAPGGTKPVEVWAPFCLKQDGFARPHAAYKVIADNADVDGHDVVVCPFEDWAYFDNRDIAPFPTDGHEFARLVDVATEAQQDEYCHIVASSIGFDRHWGDHHFHNNFDPTWVGSGAAAPAPYNSGSATRNNVYVESRKFIDRIEVPGFYNLLVANSGIRYTQLGRVMLLHINTVEYRTSTSALGAAQKAAVLAFLGDVRDGVYGPIATVVLLSPFVMGDVLWKATQDWEGQNNAKGAAFRAERADLFDAMEAAASKSHLVLEADSHLSIVSTRFRTHYNDPIGGQPRRWPKHLATVCAGAASNHGVTNLTTIINVTHSPPSGAGTLFAAASKDGVEFLSMQEVPAGDSAAMDALQMPSTGSPGYTRMVSRLQINPTTGATRVSVFDARYLNPPGDRLLFDETFSLRSGGGNVAGRMMMGMM